jgi:hypothetical protein
MSKCSKTNVNLSVLQTNIEILNLEELKKNKKESGFMADISVTQTKKD